MTVCSDQHRLYHYPLIIPSGAVREAGGAFGKKEKAQEDQYFRQQQQKQLDNLKKSHGEEIEHHEAEIKRHQVWINEISVISLFKKLFILAGGHCEAQGEDEGDGKVIFTRDL